MKCRQGNTIDHLRISVTQDCNLSCPYCHREGEEGDQKEMSFDEIRRIVKAATDSGMKKIKITGGEPLIRKDIVEIVKMIKKCGAEEISMTTNGTLLWKYANELKNAGLDRVNVGCDSVTSGMLQKSLQHVKKGLLAAKTAGFDPVKINMVVMKDINHHEIPAMIEVAKETGCMLQLIELIEIGQLDYEKHYFSLDGIEEELSRKAQAVNVRNMQNRKQFNLGEVTVELVRPSNMHFCAACNKMRVTSNGKLKPCFMRDDNLVEFKDINSIKKAVEAKEVYYD